MFALFGLFAARRPTWPVGRPMSSEETDAVTNGRWGYMQSVINGMHAKFNSQQCNQRYNQTMSGSIPVVRPKGRSARSRAAFGCPPTHSTRLTAQGEGYEAATAIQLVP